MTAKDKAEAFPLLMTKLLLTCHQRERNELETVLQLEAYFEALEPFPLPEVDSAVRAAIAECGRVFMPSPGELIEFIQQERRRRRAEAEARRSLPLPKEPTPEESEEVRRLLEGLRAKLQPPRRVDEPLDVPPTPEEEERHRRRQREAIELCRQIANGSATA